MPSLTILEPNKEPRTMPLDNLPLVIGRSKSRCQLSFDFLGLSSRHCEIVEAGETFKVLDLESANKTYVNSREVVEHYLNHGDRIALTDIVLIFNNEKQRQPGKKAGQSPVAAPPEDSVDRPSEMTFVMGGDQWQQKIAEIQAGTMPGGNSKAGKSADPKGAKGQPVGMKAGDYAAAFNKGTPQENVKVSSFPWIFVVIALVAALALAIGLAFYYAHH